MTAKTPAASSGALARDAALVLGGSLFLAASARILVPMLPVPMTMQSFAVLFLGGALGARLGALAVLATLGEAALGLPVLAGGAALLGPTTGYLAGFVPAAIAAGVFARGGSPWWRSAAGLLLGQLAIYVAGLAWLDLAVLHDPARTLAVGLLPFLPGDALKLALAGAALAALRHLPRRTA